MTEKKIERTVITNIYIAEDGTEFSSKLDCEKYEVEDILLPKLIGFKSIYVPEGNKRAGEGSVYIAKINSIEDFENLIKYYSLTHTCLNVNYVIGKYYKPDFNGKYVFVWSEDLIMCDTVEWLKNDLIERRTEYDTTITNLEKYCH